MAEPIQALELQVMDNAQQAANGVSALAATLSALKAQIGSGINFGNTASEIAKFAASVTAVATQENVTKINKLASAIDRLANAGSKMSAIGSTVKQLETDMAAAGVAPAGKPSAGIRTDTPATVAPKVDTSGIAEAVNGTREISSNLKDAATTAPQVQISTDPGKYPEYVKHMQESKAATDGVAQSTKAVAMETAQVKTEMVRASDVLKTNGTIIKGMEVNTVALANAFLQANGSTGIMQMKLNAMKDDLGRMVASGTATPKQLATAASAIQSMELKIAKDAEREATLKANEALKAEKAAHRDAAAAAKEHAASVKAFREAVGNILKPLKNLASQFLRIAKMRIIRYALRQISEGFRTGLENVREYSKAIGGLYAKDMQGLDNSLLQMKNSLGAMAAQLAQTLLPVFQTLVNWVIEAANAINQFIALLSGKSSWTKAVYVEQSADAIDKVGNSASGASKKMKNLLADWDELNIIQQESGGSGRTGTSGTKDATDYTKMFIESNEFAGWIKDAVQWLEDHTAIVYGALAGIAGMLLGLNGRTILMAIALTTAYSAGYKAGENGEGLFSDVQSTVISALEGGLAGALIGGSITKSVTGAIVGFAVGAVVTIAAQEVGWMVGNYKAYGDKSFVANLEDDLLNIIGPAVLGGVTGYLIGSIVGHPVAGAIIGFTLMAAVSLAASILKWNSEDSTARIDRTFGEAVIDNVAGILALGTAGGAVGFMVGGAYGAAIGAIIGVGVGLVMTAIQWKKEQSMPVLTLDLEEIKQEVQNLFKFDIYAEIENMNIRVNDLEKARRDIDTDLQKLAGDWKVLLTVGLESATPQQVQKIAGEVQTLVDEVNSYLSGVSTNIGIMLNLNTNTFTSSEIAGMEGAAKDASSLQSVVTGLGNEIGGYLSDGIIDEVEAKTLPALMQTLSNITSAITQGQAVGGLVADVKQAGSKLNPETSTADDIAAFRDEFTSVQSDAMEAARRQAVEYQTELFGIAYGMKASGKYSQAEIDAAFARAESVDIEKITQEYYDTLIGPATEEYNKLLIRFIQADIKSRSNGAEGSAVSSLIRLWSEDGSDFGAILGSDDETIREQFAVVFPAIVNETIGTNAMAATHYLQGATSFEGVYGAYYSMMTDEMKRALYDSMAEAGLGQEYVTWMKEFLGIDIDYGTKGATGGQGTVSASAVTINTPNVTYTGETPTVGGEGSEGSGSDEAEERADRKETNRLLGQLNQKQFVVNLVPSAALGRVVARSMSMYEAVSG